MVQPLAKQRDSELVTSSVLRSADTLGVTLSRLARVLGVGEATMKNCSRGTASLTRHKQQELALGLIRVYRALYAILGGDEAQMKHWMRTANRHLSQQVPLDLIETYQGLAQVNLYLDAMRGRV
jgi:uncharacterized protein (DUF2384 family)